MKIKLFYLVAVLVAVASFITSCQSEAELDFKRYYTTGSLVYQTHCQNCHSTSGEGLGVLIPPLTDSGYLKNNKNRLACIIKYGLKDSIAVKGKSYKGVMVPQGDLSAIEIAQVITYVNNSFGNALGLTDAKQIEGDLLKCGQ